MDRYIIQREYAEAYRLGDTEAMEKCRQKLLALEELQLVKYKLEKYAARH